jgi:glucose-6-phosphate 1-dehydrogenase
MNECTVIVFGATGDLTRRKLIPAFYDLVKRKKLDKLALIGAAHDKVTAEQMLEAARPFIANIDEKVWQKITESTRYQRLDFSEQQDFVFLKELVETVEKEQNLSGNRIAYCASPPQFFCDITTNSGASGLLKKKDVHATPYHRIIYEKPFGSDEKTAQEINECISQWFDESQIYRIDHYLTKEIVSSIALVRFANTIFEPLWNANYIASVEVVLSEEVDLQGRGAYYDEYGVLKDMVQNHVLQLLALVAMEEPSSLTGDGLRDAKVKVLQETKIIEGWLGQYEGYTQESGVDPDSTTPTFAFLQLAVNNERWKNVPFYCVTGKRLEKKETLIRITFRTITCALKQVEDCKPNYLTINIFPESGFSLGLNAKKPDTLGEVGRISMDFCQSCEMPLTPEYVTIFEEVLLGEESISVRFDEIEYAWNIVDKIITEHMPIYKYLQGTKGPQEAVTLAQKKGVRW